MNVMGVHKYSVNYGVRAEFWIFSICNFWSPSTGSANLGNLKESSSACQSYEDSMNFPKGFARKIKTFLHTIYFFLSL